MNDSTITATLALLFAACGGATHHDVKDGGIVAGADSRIRVAQTEAGDRRVHIDIARLPPPQRLGLDLSTYTVWLVAPGAPPFPAGNLEYDRRSRRARLEIVTALRDFRVLVTAEPFPSLDRPSPVVILERYVTT